MRTKPFKPSRGPASNRPRAVFSSLGRISFALFLGALSLAWCTGHARAGENRLTPHDLLRLRTVLEAEISLDGNEIAYLLSRPRNPFEEENGPAYAELHVVDWEGNSRPFVTGEVEAGQVAWRPGHQEISYSARRGEDAERSLYVIPLEGGESRKALEHSTSLSAYAWNPDGEQVAFLAVEERSEEESKRRGQGFEPEVYEESARPVRVWIAPLGNAAQETNARMLELPGSASAVHWSPDGAKLAVALAPTPLVDDALMRRVVHVVDVETGAVSARLEHAAKLGDFRWSPDGRHLFTISGENINDPREGRLYLWGADGERVRELAPGYAGHIWSAAWVDPETICYVGYESVWTVMVEVNIQNGRRRTLLPSEGVIAGDLSWSGNGRAAFTGHSPEHPREAFVLDRAAPAARRLTRSNAWLEEAALAPHEVVRHRARDGLELEGILIRPLEVEEGRADPLILVVHGGPEAHFPNGWLTGYGVPGQIAAARGFALFYPNYRGSTGRGVEFSKAGQGDPAGREFDDLIDAVDHLIELGVADGGRVGITGASYGGYASAWGATYYSHRFAASVMSVGLSNWLSAFGTTDIPDEMYLVHFRKWVAEDPEFFFERSAVAHVDKHQTPILILHGKEDTRVHPSQSLELYRYLKQQQQAPVRLVLYPGEGHSNRNAATQLDYALRLMQWMEHYLAGPGGEPPPHALDYDWEW